MDLERLGKQFQAKMRRMYQMNEVEFLREVEWMQSQPMLSKDLEKGILRLFREVVNPHKDRPISDWLDNIPVVRLNCLKQFTWRRILGRGEYGKVYLIHDGSRYYALKEIDLEVLGPRFAPKLKNEILLTKRAGEAGIGPKVYDAYLCDDRLYLRMEYIDGTPLHTWVERHVLSGRDRDTIMSLLDRLHKLGVAHQDLHSGNIMVQERTPGNPVFRIIDYGFAETTETLMETERKQVENMLQEIAERDESLVRQWALYQLIHEGHIKIPPAVSPSPRRRQNITSVARRSKSTSSRKTPSAR